MIILSEIIINIIEIKMYTLCLPKIDNNTTRNQLFNVFNQYNFGLIKKIDLITILCGTGIIICNSLIAKNISDEQK